MLLFVGLSEWHFVSQLRDWVSEDMKDAQVRRRIGDGELEPQLAVPGLHVKWPLKI